MDGAGGRSHQWQPRTRGSAHCVYVSKRSSVVSPPVSEDGCEKEDGRQHQQQESDAQSRVQAWVSDVMPVMTPAKVRAAIEKAKQASSEDGSQPRVQLTDRLPMYGKEAKKLRAEVWSLSKRSSEA